ncbi:MAG: dTDP-4-dehydrorhamnose reductase [Campylobacter sp.]|nr:dTDP-4-dehydrorhamnose reductase [Campylobacter sp.]
MLRILITGANGQLGSEFKDLENSSEYEFYFASHDELDITDQKGVEAFFGKNKFDALINCAAYTAVDKAEDEAELAFDINEKGARNLALIAKEKGIKFLHISTDYVFGGDSPIPYTPSDKTAPKGVYGKSKLAGENEILRISPANSAIIRISWLYGTHGKNFVKTMLNLASQRDKLNVVYDQVGSPTYARDLALALLKMAKSISNIKTQIYHYANEGVTSWYDMAQEIMNFANLKCQILPIRSHEYPSKATRPAFSVLDKADIKRDFELIVPHWRASLGECIKILGNKNA